MYLCDVVLVCGDCARCGCCGRCRIFCETGHCQKAATPTEWYHSYPSRNLSNCMPRVSAVVSTTRGTSRLPGALLRRIRLRPTTSSSGKPSISLCIPGVLTEGGARGRDDERACRLRAEGASLRGSSGALSERRTASTMDDIVELWLCFCVSCEGEISLCSQRHEKGAGDATPTRFN